MKNSGATINKHVIYGIVMGLIKADLTRYDGYLDFVITKGWIQSLYKIMNMFRVMVTTSRPIVTGIFMERIENTIS